MPYVVSLICDPARPILTESTAAAVARALPGRGQPEWLARGVALDIPLEPDADGKAALKAANEVVGTLPIDLNIVPAENRRKRLLLADMDSTMIEQECLDELADLIGLKEKVAAITERTMRGELEFASSLVARVALLKGLPVEKIDRLLAERIALMPGGRTLVMTMRAHGAYTALVSGGFTLFTGPVAARIGFDEHRGNVLDVEAGTLAGTVAEPILGRESKREALIGLRDGRGLNAEDTLAVGDGANDLAMLHEAGLGVAFRAKPAVSAAAAARIEQRDLTALLYLQGYRREEFAD